MNVVENLKTLRHLMDINLTVVVIFLVSMAKKHLLDIKKSKNKPEKEFEIFYSMLKQTTHLGWTIKNK